MPLKDRDRNIARRLNRLGFIRLGHKVEGKREDGSTYTRPVQDDHFLLHDAPEIAVFYGDNVREIDVLLPFPDVGRNYDAWYEVWAGGVLVCKGDGEIVEQASPFTVRQNRNGRTTVHRGKGGTLVNRGVAQRAFSWNGVEFSEGDVVECPGAKADKYPHCAACRLSGILKVMMAKEELFRFGYYQLSTGSGRNYDSILGTLETIWGSSGSLQGIPFVLRLVEESTTYNDKGERKSTRKWFVKLEPESEFMRELYRQQMASMLAPPPQAAPVALLADVVTGEIVAEPEAPPPFAEDGDFAEGETVATEPEPAPKMPGPKLLAGYGKLIALAEELGVNHDTITVTATDEQLRKLGVDLKKNVDAAIAARDAAQPTQPTQGHKELMNEWSGLWSKACVLGVKAVEPITPQLPDADLAARVEDLRSRIIEAEKQIDDVTEQPQPELL